MTSLPRYFKQGIHNKFRFSRLKRPHSIRFFMTTTLSVRVRVEETPQVFKRERYENSSEIWDFD